MTIKLCPIYPVDFLDEPGLSLVLESLLFAESPKPVCQLFLVPGSVHVRWGPPADSRFDGVSAATGWADELAVPAFEPAASVVRRARLAGSLSNALWSESFAPKRINA
jgi:hypothetical protein